MNFGGTSSPIDRGLKNLAKSNIQLKTQLTDQRKQEMFAKRMLRLQQALSEKKIEVAIITDQDNIYYLTGYHDYLHMEFGRPTILIVFSDGKTSLITPAIDENSAQALAKVDRISVWNDGSGNEWREELPATLKGISKIAIETDYIPPPVQVYLNQICNVKAFSDVTPILSNMRMIKSSEELQIARHAGQVANAMVTAGRLAIKDGVPEYEVALATSEAGTRKAADLLRNYYKDDQMSPNIHFLQIMASGKEITKTHHRATNRIMKRGEPVFLCFCGMTNFNRFKLGFDRTFWINEIADKSQADIYQVAIESQKAALEALRPGVTAQSIHAAYATVIKEAGYEYPFRCGRSTGFSFLESPSLVTGDETVIQPGMVFAVDGSVLAPNFRAQIGDSFIITPDGYEALTDHPKTISEVIL